MTKYEELMTKYDKCMECARNTSGLMRAIWRTHAEKLKQKARSLPVTKAGERIAFHPIRGDIK